MLSALSDHYSAPEIRDIRRAIYAGPGYHVVEGFVSRDLARAIGERWFSGAYNFHFADYLKNTEVRRGSPNYFIARPGPDDWAFACHLWNPPLDEIAHGLVLEAQQLRNLVESRPLQFATRPFDPLQLQYRVCRTLSAGPAVKPHADFMEEFRADPTGSHAFDPRRCQLTLFLSDFGEDYRGGGFTFTANDGRRVVFGIDAPARTGDLVIWKYSNAHEVSDVEALNPRLGFARIIVPLFDASSLDAPS